MGLTAHPLYLSIGITNLVPYNEPFNLGRACLLKPAVPRLILHSSPPAAQVTPSVNSRWHTVCVGGWGGAGGWGGRCTLQCLHSGLPSTTGCAVVCRGQGRQYSPSTPLPPTFQPPAGQRGQKQPKRMGGKGAAMENRKHAWSEGRRLEGLAADTLKGKKIGKVVY